MKNANSSWSYSLLALALSVWAAFPSTQASATGPASNAPDASKKPAALPGGAQALSETFDDWLVGCASPQGKKHCVVSQQQTDSKTQQRLLAIELQPHNGGADGALVLPFGLELDKGVTLKAGDAQIGSTLRFKTCLPQGCVAPVSFDQKTIELLNKAPTMTVIAYGDAGQSASFQISLKGFGPALSRAAVLAE